MWIFNNILVVIWSNSKIDKLIKNLLNIQNQISENVDFAGTSNKLLQNFTNQFTKPSRQTQK